MRILMIGDQMPFPAVSGGSQRVYHLLERAGREHEVTYVAPIDGEYTAEVATEMGRICARVVPVPVKRQSPLAHLPGLLAHTATGKPPELHFHCSQALLARVGEVAREQEFDLAHVEHSHMALALEAMPATLQQRSLLVLQNVEFETFARIARMEPGLGAKARAFANSAMLRRWEPRYAEHFRLCAAMSAVDRDLMLRANPRLDVEVVPNGVDSKRLRPLPRPEGGPALVFVGTMSYAPGADAATYFCREVLPLVRRQMPQVELWLVGADPPPAVRRLEAIEGVHVTGRVPDVKDYYARSALSVVPLRAGGGTRLKILEAMALGRPVVSTGLGAEGLDAVDGEHLRIADEPPAFAAAVVDLLRDDAAYARLAANGRRLVEEVYDWDVIAAQLLRVYERVAGATPVAVTR